MRRLVCRSLPIALAWCAACAAAAVHAEESAADTASPLYKLTTGVYPQSGGGVPASTGVDVNLRRTVGDGNVWVGWFRSPGLAVTQTRGGWDQVFSLGPVRLLPSLQVASGGFWGGSFGVETGASWFAGAGLGRTNLRNYVNLNFDPNDSWSLSGGYRWPEGRALSLLVVHDNRQNPDQQHVHWVYRTPMPDGQRLTVDVLSKTGTVAGEAIHKLGLSVDYDWPSLFIRVAYDPKVNFTAQNMWRAQVGTRF